MTRITKCSGDFCTVQNIYMSFRVSGYMLWLTPRSCCLVETESCNSSWFHLDSILSGFSASLLPPVSRDSPCLRPGSFFPLQLFFGGFPLAGAPVSLLLDLPLFSSVACGLLAAQSRLRVCSHPCSRPFMYDVGPWSSSYSCSYPFYPTDF